MSKTAKHVSSAPQKCAKIPCNILLLVFTLVLSCLVDWMIALSHSNKEKTTHIGHFTLSGTSVACGRSICSHNSLAPPPHAGHQPGHILLWDGIPFLNQELLKFNQRGCVGHSSTYSTPKLIPQMFNWVEFWSHGRPFHPFHSQILEVLCDDPGSVGAGDVILEDGVRSQILAPESHSDTSLH